jgi:predicted RNA binding protein YcfA (HicA-like mRNA interferase family)
MRLPRNIGGKELAKLLKKYGYSITRQTGSHIRLTSYFKGTEHHVSIPNHEPLRIGTLGNLLKDIASYLETDRQELLEELFFDNIRNLG